MHLKITSPEPKVEKMDLEIITSELEVKTIDLEITSPEPKVKKMDIIITPVNE